ncbi:unnamed protein product [Schistocephalus solidus]|uniref:FERM C-terminal PH-like domain-containing protein n=1 Tax=Schistocephalus solidus TaxID=70667 RepID=A0A3P7CUC6_SCHSO|nr:unnamed protein product [Schistocephalus solidus]
MSPPPPTPLQATGRETIDFYFNSRNSCKNFWKKCLEHHAFFRSRDVHGVAGQGSGSLGSPWSAPATHPYASQPHLQSSRTHSSLNGAAPAPTSLNRSNSLTSRRGQNIFSKGSSYRYFGRTYQQLLEGSHTSKEYGVTVEQRSKSVGLLAAGLNLPYPSSPNARRNSAGFGGIDGPVLPCNGLRRCRTGFGSSLSTVAGLSQDFGNTSLPDHYRLLLLSTPIHRPFSARSRTASSHSVDRSSLNTGSTLGSTLMEAEAGCQVPRVFSVNALKLRSQAIRGKKQTNSASFNNETPVGVANDLPDSVNGGVPGEESLVSNLENHTAVDGKCYAVPGFKRTLAVCSILRPRISASWKEKVLTETGQCSATNEN